MNYAPKGKPNPVVAPGEFRFAAMALNHGHIYGMCNGLIEAGGTLVAVHDNDPARVATFVQRYPQAKVLAQVEELLFMAVMLYTASTKAYGWQQEANP